MVKINEKRNKGIKHTAETNKKKSLSGSKNPIFGKTFYEIWIIKYGKEIADKKLNEYKKRKKGKKLSIEHKKI